MRIDNLMQMPKDKRPPKSIWGNEKQLKEYLDRVYDSKKQEKFEFIISDDEIEG